MVTRKKTTSTKESPPPRSGVNIKKISKVKRDHKGRVSATRKRFRQRYAGRDITHIDWRGVDPGWFDNVSPGSPEWLHVQETLERPPASRERRELLTKLAEEVSRIYCHYRRAAHRRDMKTPSHYKVTQGERNYTRQIAERCVLKGIHPKKHIMYWDKEVGRFTSMKWPTLMFLRGAGVIEESVSTAGSKKRSKAGPREKNSHASAELDPGLRSALEDAGFETQDYSDRYLVTIEAMARRVAEGSRVFLPKGSVRNMARWAAENLYETD